MLVYLITNKVNGKQYVGQTIRTLRQRWASHTMSARNGVKYAICNAIRKYGEKKFSVETLRVCRTRKQMNHVEIFYIKKFRTLYPSGYNLTPGGDSPVFTEETKAKMRKVKLGKHFSPATEFKKGYRFSPKTEFKKRHRPSPKTEFKSGQTPWNKGTHYRAGSSHAFFGKHHSVATKKAMRIAKLGKPRAWQVPWHHGNGYAYGNKHCRCEVCREWKRNSR